jgi:uncharacterized protein (DUF433 family)
MPKNAPAPSAKPQGFDDVELSDQYRAIGSAAILAALACKMKQQDKKTVAPERSRRAA